MGADRSPDGEGVWLFFLHTSIPVSIPHVYTVAMTTSRAMTTPTTPPEFRVSKATSHVPTHMVHLRVIHHRTMFLLPDVSVEVVDTERVVIERVVIESRVVSILILSVVTVVDGRKSESTYNESS